MIILPVLRSFRASDYGLHPVMPEVFDATMISDFETCPSKFYLRHILGLKRAPTFGPGHESNDLLWGTMWHKLMHEWYRNMHVLDWEEAIQKSIVTALKDWPQSLNAIEDQQLRTQERMIMIFSQYLETFGDQDAANRVLRHEQYFDIYCEPGNPSCPFGGCDLRWCGRMDRIEEIRAGILVHDYKTTRRMTADYFDRYEHSWQIPGYTWAGMHMTTGKVIGARIDCLHTIKDKHEFFRRTIPYTPHRILEWVYQVKKKIASIHEMFDAYPDEPEAWEKRWGSCMDFGKCYYADVHFTPPIEDTRMRILQEEYVEDRWDPSEVEAA